MEIQFHKYNTFENTLKFILSRAQQPLKAMNEKKKKVTKF